jgi:hypothetical protein
LAENVKITKTCLKCGGAKEIVRTGKEGSFIPVRQLGIKFYTCPGELID